MANAVEILSAMETDLMVSIIKNLAKGNIGSAEWQARQLGRRNRSYDNAQEIVRAGTVEARESLINQLAMESAKTRNATDATMKGSKFADNLPANADESLKAVLTTWEARAAEQVNLIGANLLKSSNKMYIDVVETVTAQVLAGDITGREAMRRASASWADSGLPALVDKAGRRWSTEAYAQTIVRSNVRNVVTDTQLSRAQQYGSDLVEVDSHVGARPGCEPYQGKVFSISGNSKKYPALSSTTMGEPAGLFGVNCGHSMYPYFPGDKRTYKPVPKEQNQEAYRNSQKQRQIERNIRGAKQREAMANAAGDVQGAARAAESVRNNQAAMRQFIDNTGRTRQRAREQIRSFYNEKTGKYEPV